MSCPCPELGRGNSALPVCHEETYDTTHDPFLNRVRVSVMPTGVAPPNDASFFAIRSFLNELAYRIHEMMKDRDNALTLDRYIAERKYFGILLCNTTDPSKYTRWPLIVQYSPAAEQILARKFLLWIEFASKSISDWAELSTTPDYFIQNKYTTIRKMIPPYLLSELQNCYNTGIQNGRIGFLDEQSYRYVAQNDRCGRIMLFNYVDLVRRAIAHNARPTYSYFGGYVNGSYLNPHSDRYQCEFSFSITIQQNPPDQAWPLGMAKSPQFEKNDIWPGRDKLPWPDEKEQVWIDLYESDGLLFMGRHMVHFRKGLLLGENRIINQVFLHFVQENFPGILD